MIKIAFAFPKGMPKLSGLTTPLRTPELQFEKMALTTFDIELPRGPLSMLLNFQRSFEIGETPEFPEFPGFPEFPSELPKPPELQGILAKFPKLPGLPELPFGEGSSSSSSIIEKETHSPFENTHTRSPRELEELRKTKGILFKNTTPAGARTPTFPKITLTKS